jgi:hypothetical protein
MYVVRIPSIESDGAETLGLWLRRLLLLLEVWSWRRLADAVAGDLHGAGTVYAGGAFFLWNRGFGVRVEGWEGVERGR